MRPLILALLFPVWLFCLGFIAYPLVHFVIFGWQASERMLGAA